MPYFIFMVAEMLLKMQANSGISGKIEDQTLTEKIIGPRDLTFFFNVGAVLVVFINLYLIGCLRSVFQYSTDSGPDIFC